MITKTVKKPKENKSSAVNAAAVEDTIDVIRAKIKREIVRLTVSRTSEKTC